jgi:hypothetical protein
MAATVRKAQNLEKARDFEAAAKAYQDAGLYDDAGRVRQSHLEKDAALVNIGQVGDTVLQDSVMIQDTAATPVCQGCGAEVQAGWNICPHCQATL